MDLLNEAIPCCGENNSGGKVENNVFFPFSLFSQNLTL
jgi:hypothetical protein